MAMMFCAVIDHRKARWRERSGQQRFHFLRDWAFGHIISMRTEPVVVLRPSCQTLVKKEREGFDKDKLNGY